MWVEQKAKALYSQLSNSEKTVFLSVLIGGLIAHLFIFTNIIPNFDGISRVYDEQQMTISGRWFLHYASAMNFYTQMPMVTGVLAMFFLALSGMLVVRMLRIKSSLLAGLWGVLYAVFPAVADTNTYTFTVSAYCIGVFLAVLGVAVTKNRKYGFLGGTVFLAFSMGIYQTYVTVAIILCVLLIMQDTLTAQSKVRDILIMSGKYILYLGMGTLLYYLILKVFLHVKDLQLISYLGMSDVEQGYPVDQLGATLKKTYLQVWDFFFGGADGLENPWYWGVNALLVVVSAVLIIGVIRKQKIYRDVVKLSGLIVLIMLLPLAVNFVQVISPYSAPRLIMKLAFAYIYLLPVILLNQVKENEVGKLLTEGAGMIVAGGLVVLSIYFWQYDNVLYTMLNQAHRATLSFVTNVVSRIESCEGYHSGMQIVVIGRFPSEKYDSDIEVYDYVKTGSALSSTVIPLNKHIYYYMNDWLNVPAEEPEDELCFGITETDAFRQMPLYPDDGSVQVIGDCVVVKMRETYTPKSLYEKEYDNRR